MKCSIKVDSILNKDLRIMSILEEVQKEELVDKLLREGLEPYIKKYQNYRFGGSEDANK